MEEKKICCFFNKEHINRLVMIKNYGTKYHDKPMHLFNDGERILYQCYHCKNYVLVQHSEYNGWDDDYDYNDAIPVESIEEADYINDTASPYEFFVMKDRPVYQF